jgi:hypothetical protein
MCPPCLLKEITVFEVRVAFSDIIFINFFGSQLLEKLKGYITLLFSAHSKVS